MRETVVGLGKTVWLQDGTKVEAKTIDGPEIDRELNSTAEHEAFHVAAGLFRGVGVIMATNIPGPGYGGFAQFTSFDSVVAAAPEAFGCGGTGMDLQMIEENGDSVQGAVAAARALLHDRWKHVAAIATAIQRKRVISGAEARSVKQRVDDGSTVEVKITKASGQVERREKHFIRDDRVQVPIDRNA